MLTIHLNNLSFHAYHGVYEQEKTLGNTFIVNMEVDYMPRAWPVTQLQDALNYEALFAMVYTRMMQPTELLETLVVELAAQIMQGFSEILQMSIRIEKTNPPIPHLQGSIAVSYKSKRGSTSI